MGSLDSAPLMSSRVSFEPRSRAMLSAGINAAHFAFTSTVPFGYVTSAPLSKARMLVPFGTLCTHCEGHHPLDVILHPPSTHSSGRVMVEQAKGTHSASK